MIIDIDEHIRYTNVKGDKDRLSQVLVNLLSNALKFTFKGFIKVSVNEIERTNS